ncbi:UDP-N-acetylglucosamine 2-epimerase [Campylobacter hyointestinalis subsp. hyointestinalis]|uniref:UDP-N-acetylglucosamine 2-epimerase n=1 Tax=Campylobacter hyointestinalis subsp. hyointestinalis TaxID=91352 RepID=A0A0S4S2J0_CAMHY|nr:UDP-N-acetylglucosamine 2-epimerase [Campylobacter hyointestinalis]PPB53515.1 UDP-N-acetylglucosamine 2-epimerase (hydrolyzing) [Campylobacter hyointestinalis subsp. hyointestinalis]PPB66256.1 UDP-N-acetylglucosamine 2-epimerase (hydrolyzing) [Campylobacter hyointestinalis subsp. hyointestinalis]PPB70952.1 UDP-N-acetylglucosamine 2-epimerase (hydrolyzing) [Campylobacter hyointestinalis subsp. hyointestinalis]CUU79841.1 UDP-N-acetylglucosamine 2-epimerase [Campylobacter hyointestinalis subsp.
MTKRKICVVTGTRAEYGLLYWLIKGIQESDDLELQLIVTGAHLEERFGFTYKEIEKDFPNFDKVPLGLKNDNEDSVCHSISLAIDGFANKFRALKPDILMVLGDRYEILSATIAGMVYRIPIAHIHGGEKTEGAFDEAIRHSITKMSHLHFVATDEYARRVIQLGEEPNRVFNVGGMGIENIKRLNLLSRSEFEQSINFKLNKKNILVTFHPVTLEKGAAKEQFKELLNALDELKDTNIIFTKANADIGGKIINQMIDKYSSKNSSKAVSFASLGTLRYLSALKHVDMVVGNSSSGLAEAPSFKIATINIGDRQKGRIKADSIIDCEPNKLSIQKAINKAYTKEFKSVLENTINPYGDGNASIKIIEVLKKVNLDNILKKKFWDIGVNG